VGSNVRIRGYFSEAKRGPRAKLYFVGNADVYQPTAHTRGGK